MIRHAKERLAKCSLRPLELRLRSLNDAGFKFTRYGFEKSFTFQPQALLLGFEGELLSKKDSERELVILDASWKLASKMATHRDLKKLETRSLDKRWKTAYPRRQIDCQEPERGLASIEALYAACIQMGQKKEELFFDYHWKEIFLEKNRELLKEYLT